MTTPIDLNALMAVDLDNVKSPELKPAGFYPGTFTGYRFGTVPSGNGFCEITVVLKGFPEEISPDDYPNVPNPRGQQVRVTLWIDAPEPGQPLNPWQVKNFIHTLGIDMSGKKLAEALVEGQGSDVHVQVTKEPGKNNGPMLNNYKKVLGGVPLPAAG
jgi:hypothetical protein